MRKSYALRNSLIILTIILFAVLLVAGGMCLYKDIISKYFQLSVDVFVAIYASVAGGLCAIFGALITIFYQKIFNKELIEEQSKPAVFCPYQYDLSKMEMVRLYQDPENKTSLFNHEYRLKNSDKADFMIVKLIFDNSVFPAQDYYIEKNKLFRICFFHQNKEKLPIKLLIKTVNEKPYTMEINQNDKKVILKPKEDEN